MKVVLKWTRRTRRKRAGEIREELRSLKRTRIQSPVTLSWNDPGGYTWTVRTKGVDMSKGGARVESPEPLAPGSAAFVRVQSLQLVGGATVRYCVRRGLHYAIGLEFSKPLARPAIYQAKAS